MQKKCFGAKTAKNVSGQAGGKSVGGLTLRGGVPLFAKEIFCSLGGRVPLADRFRDLGFYSFPKLPELALGPKISPLDGNQQQDGAPQANPPENQVH